MNVLIPAKGTSRRIPLKNLQPLGAMPLLGWAIWKARRWIPDAVIHVATEHLEIAGYAMDQGCTLFPLTAADIADQRDASGPLTDFLAATVARPVISLDCSFPFLLRSELNAALSDPRGFVRPVLRSPLRAESRERW